MMMEPPLPKAGERWALFLDVDGTLVPIAPTPEAVRVDPALLASLERLQRGTEGAVALISGRPLAQIDALFQPLLLAAAGLHGLERRRADGSLEAPAAASQALARLKPVLAAYAADRPGVLFEDKGQSLALHYRLAPRYGAAICRIARYLVRGAGGELRLIEGDKVVELQPSGADKGKAILAFLAEPPFAGRIPVFAGDDTTDEDGFRAVTKRGGLSIKVRGGRVAATAAPYGLPSVTALHAWLTAVAAALAPSAAGSALATERHPSLSC